MFGNFLTKIYLKHLERKGFVHGTNFDMEKGVNIDAGFCQYISCGNNVTLAKDAYIIAHDASTKKFLGKTKFGAVNWGNNVFVGARTIILPGVNIGDNVIIGANSCVNTSIPNNQVWGGSPAKYIMSTHEFLEKHRKNMVSRQENNRISYIE